MSALIDHWARLQAERCPDAIAVALNGEQLSYGNLERTSNRIAHALLDSGCRQQDRVCLLLPKCPLAVAAMHGVLRAGAIYVPIDEASPADRIARIIERCSPRLILATAQTEVLTGEVRRLSQAARRAAIGWLSSDTPTDAALPVAFSAADLTGLPTEAPDLLRSDSDPAQIFFTSGSTGTPKGVVVRHDSVAAFIDWSCGHFGLSSTDRMSGHAPFHFDLSTFDIYAAMAVGAELHLVPPMLNLLPNKLAEFMRSKRLTHWHSVPSALAYMVRFEVIEADDFPALKRVIWCGDVLPTSVLIQWMQRLPQVQFTNLYGPTETTVASSYYTVPACPSDPTTPIPIGRACSGESLHILDPNLQPIAPGQIGEICIGGIGLSDGYWQDEESTQAAFLPAPLDDDPVPRLYRTGDYGTVDDAGCYYFQGRRDAQVKSRGYRIELAEIENALAGNTALAASAVVAVPLNGFEGLTICCAYAPVPGMRITPPELRRTLGERLPGYMIPTRWADFETLPHNANGKVDKAQLRACFAQRERI